MNEAGNLSHSRPAITATLLLLIGAAGFMAVFFGLCHYLNVSMPAFGLLFLVYWAAILKQDLPSFFPALFGGIAGIVLGWFLVTVTPLAGAAGLPVSLAAVGVTLFCFMRGHVFLFVNNATMLFLTVATISPLNVSHNIGAMIASLLLGALYMGGTTLAVRYFAGRRARSDEA